MLKSYYKLTRWLPRLLPRTPDEYLHLKKVMLEYYQVPDKDETWALLTSLIQGVERTRIKAPYGPMVNCILRLDVNKLAQNEKVKHFAILNEKLKRVAQAEIAESRAGSQNIPVPEGSPSSQGALLGMPEPQSPMV